MLEGKIALITGAGKGIGRAAAEVFVKNGAVVYAVDMLPGSLDDLCESLQPLLLPKYFDITDQSAAKSLVMEIKKNHGNLDVLVNNAALMDNTVIGMIGQNQMERLFNVNVFSLINILQLAARVMQKEKQGSIINISSMVGLRGNKGQLLYSATKGAVIALTMSAAKELASFNIRVNTIAPGLTDTDGFRTANEKHMENRIAGIGMGRLAEPVEIANACLFLASDLSSYITGELLGVHGGSVL